MVSSIEALVERGRDALREGDGLAARRAFEEARTHAETGEIIEGLAEALYLEADYPSALESYGRAFLAYRDQRELRRAALVAYTLAWLHGNLYGDEHVQGGWLGRARTVLQEAGPHAPEHGWVELIDALFEPDGAAREGGFRGAVDQGRASGDADLEFEALGWLAGHCVLTDRIEEGLALFDESLAAICAGEVRNVGVIEGSLCGMLWACERVHDIGRAEQWIRTADFLVKRRNMVAVGAVCRAHYGGILTAAGRWAEAELELTEAVRLVDHGYPVVRAGVLVRLADLRLRQGRFEEAAQLLEGNDQHPNAILPVAALHLARGDTQLARDVLERASQRADDETPMVGEPSGIGPVLALLVEVQLAEGADNEASVTAERLKDVADHQPTVYLRAAAAFARAQVCIASGTEDPRVCLSEALSGFAQAQMPMELARARLELARASIAERPAVAVAEAKAALEVFERLDAARHVDAAAALLRSLGAHVRVGPKGHEALTKRETEILGLLGLGLSNPEIADRLYISRKTAGHHVSRILSKLGLRSRAEAAAYTARRSGGTSPSR